MGRQVNSYNTAYNCTLRRWWLKVRVSLGVYLVESESWLSASREALQKEAFPRGEFWRTSRIGQLKLGRRAIQVEETGRQNARYKYINKERTWHVQRTVKFQWILTLELEVFPFAWLLLPLSHPLSLLSKPYFAQQLHRKKKAYYSISPVMCVDPRPIRRNRSYCMERMVVHRSLGPTAKIGSKVLKIDG